MADPNPDPHPDWRALNRANWDERVPIHRAVPYGNGDWADGTQRLNPIEEAELGPVDGLDVLHLQCHFGRDSLILAHRGARVTGIDFSAPAIAAARADSEALGIPATFLEADLYDATAAHARPGSFDLVYTTWGTTCWLPDLQAWARIVAQALRPGGRLYFADIHPIALVLDDAASLPDGRPGWFVPYFEPGPVTFDDPADYADPQAHLINSRTVNYLHTTADLITILHAAGLTLDWLHEHPTLTWKQFACLVEAPDGTWTWPDRPWLPLALSLQASKPITSP